MQGTGITKKPSTLMKHLILISFVILNLNILAREIEETTFSYWDKPDSQIYYSTPKTIDADTKIIFIMHGASRGAKKYLNDWLPLAKGRNVVLIAPEFTKESYPEYVYLMMSTERGKLLKDSSLYLTDSLGLLFDYFKSKFDLSTNTFRLYGHSGGSQFVHRYLLLSDESRVEKAAMANAGFYTFADAQIAYPFGIKNMDVSNERLEWFLRLKGGVFLGDADNDPNHHSLPSMRKAKKQGKHRFERGTNFFNDLIKLGVEKNLPFRWRYQTVPNIAHDNAGMSLAASEFLLEDL
jgi:pimeloyl-ACP methyl ester carboxylesterase